jgi:hypothetical protein
MIFIYPDLNHGYRGIFRGPTVLNALHVYTAHARSSFFAI